MKEAKIGLADMLELQKQEGANAEREKTKLIVQELRNDLRYIFGKNPSFCESFIKMIDKRFEKIMEDKE